MVTSVLRRPRHAHGLDGRREPKVTDHYLVALARQNSLSLATFDEPLARAFGSEIGLVELLR